MSKRLLVGASENEGDTLAAIRASRKRGFKVVDVYAPYAVHGIEEAMGLAPSRLPWVVFALGALGGGLKVWFERFIIIVTSLSRDFIPANWFHYAPTSVEVATLLGSFGLFFTLFLLFCRFIPVIAVAEVKGVLNSGKAGLGSGHE